MGPIPTTTRRTGGRRRERARGAGGSTPERSRRSRWARPRERVVVVVVGFVVGSSSDSDSDVEGGGAEGSGSGPEDTAENGWTWSTGAAPGATLARGATAKKKKPILMPGEKRSLKKRHMAELRAARAEARNGWTPEDVKRELESMVAAGRREWTPRDQRA